MTEGVTAHNPVQETIGDFVLNQPTVPVSTLDAPAGPRRYRGGQLTITLNKTKEGHDRRQACSKSRLRICCFQLRLGPQRCQLLVRHLGTSMVIALLLRNQKKPALTVLADPLSASRLTAKVRIESCTEPDGCATAGRLIFNAALWYNALWRGYRHTVAAVKTENRHTKVHAARESFKGTKLSLVLRSVVMLKQQKRQEPVIGSSRQQLTCCLRIIMI